MWQSIEDRTIKSPRDSLLLVYDRESTVNYAGYAAIMGKYKLVSGDWGSGDISKHYLAAGGGLDSTQKLEERRLHSRAHAILMRHDLVKDRDANWREEATVKCSWNDHLLTCNDGPCEDIMKSPTGYDFLGVDVTPVNETFTCDFANEPCLFDLEKDPCETMNIAKIYPEILQELLDFVNTFEAAEPTTSNAFIDCFDPNSDPIRTDPPVWQPWAKGCDGLLGEECPHSVTRDDGDFCPPGAKIRHKKRDVA